MKEGGRPSGLGAGFSRAAMEMARFTSTLCAAFGTRSADTRHCRAGGSARNGGASVPEGSTAAAPLPPYGPRIATSASWSPEVRTISPSCGPLGSVASGHVEIFGPWPGTAILGTSSCGFASGRDCQASTAMRCQGFAQPDMGAAKNCGSKYTSIEIFGA